MLNNNSYCTRKKISNLSITSREQTTSDKICDLCLVTRCLCLGEKRMSNVASFFLDSIRYLLVKSPSQSHYFFLPLPLLSVVPSPDPSDKI